ncbi:MAG: zinc ribbon domain-containing protein [Candidatus Marinimicrobia bacterium]|nr:zinc ribbon domain-containing protein [Candidatus Neomarinimicrobiota bacterium]
MPTYSYVCNACGHGFDHFQSMTDKVIKKCPSCRKLKLKRLIGAGAGLIFKGSGFYITDYGRKSNDGKEKKPAPVKKESNGSSTQSDKSSGKKPAD